MDRNEVEMDLNKFMAMIQDKNVNPHQKWIHLARAVDAWRIFPRVFLSVYIFLLYYSTMWFMALEDPSLEQSGLISITYNGVPVATPRPFLCPIVKLTIPLCWPSISPSTDFK
jgi:hypothetical protein